MPPRATFAPSCPRWHLRRRSTPLPALTPEQMARGALCLAGHRRCGVHPRADRPTTPDPFPSARTTPHTSPRTYPVVARMTLCDQPNCPRLIAAVNATHWAGLHVSAGPVGSLLSRTAQSSWPPAHSTHWASFTEYVDFRHARVVSSCTRSPFLSLYQLPDHVQTPALIERLGVELVVPLRQLAYDVLVIHQVPCTPCATGTPKPRPGRRSSTCSPEAVAPGGPAGFTSSRRSTPPDHIPPGRSDGPSPVRPLPTPQHGVLPVSRTERELVARLTARRTRRHQNV